MAFIYKRYNKALKCKTCISVQYTALLNLHFCAMHSNTLSKFIKYKTLHHMNYFYNVLHYKNDKSIKLSLFCIRNGTEKVPSCGNAFLFLLEVSSSSLDWVIAYPHRGFLCYPSVSLCAPGWYIKLYIQSSFSSASPANYYTLIILPFDAIYSELPTAPTNTDKCKATNQLTQTTYIHLVNRSQLPPRPSVREYALNYLNLMHCVLLWLPEY